MLNRDLNNMPPESKRVIISIQKNLEGVANSGAEP